MTDIQTQLFAMQDLEYRTFQSKLLPTIDPATVIGVRTPQLWKFAKRFAKTEDADRFLRELPHTYHEENNLHGMLIMEMREIDRVVSELERFLPYVDNWATCDLIRPKALGTARDALLPHIQRWMADECVYTIRFGIEMLMLHFLDEAFKPEYLEWVASIRSEEYYVKMMVAWYFATALSKQYDSVLPILQSGQLDLWTHNKTIQKAVESFRITDEQKTYLCTLKRK